MSEFEDNRPGSVFSELSSEPDRLFIHEDIDETLNSLEPQQSHITLTSAYLDRPSSRDGVVDYSNHGRTSWNCTNGSQNQVTSQLFRPFSPAASPQFDASRTTTPVQHNQYVDIFNAPYVPDVKPFSHTPDVKPYFPTSDVKPFSYTPDVNPYSYKPDVKPYYHTPDVKPYSNTPDAEVSYFYTLSRWEDGADSYYNPGSDRSTITPSSVSTSHSGTPTELDVTEWMDNDCETIIRTQDYQPKELKGKTKKRKETMRGSFPYKRHPKPPYTYCGMIVTAIMLSQQKKLTLGGIHKKLSELFEFFRGSYKGWRHSVRHNLSYNDCFFKDDLVIDSIEEKRNVYNWRVDHTKIPYGALCLQRTVEGRSGDYQEHIHEQLSIPVGIYGFDIWPSCRCKKLNVETDKTMDATPMRLEETSSSLRHLRLPVMIDCTLSTESPEAYRSRDVANNSSFNASFHEQDEKQSASPVMATGSHHISRILQASGGPTGFGSISRYIMSTDGSDWTSSAAENLSFLCQTPCGL